MYLYLFASVACYRVSPNFWLDCMLLLVRMLEYKRSPSLKQWYDNLHCLMSLSLRGRLSAEAAKDPRLLRPSRIDTVSSAGTEVQERYCHPLTTPSYPDDGRIR